jgi:hypothetical protein
LTQALEKLEVAGWALLSVFFVHPSEADVGMHAKGVDGFMPKMTSIRDVDQATQTAQVSGLG